MIKKSAYLYASKMMGYALRLILPAVLVRILVKSDFGEYRQFFLIQSTLVLLFELGVTPSLYYFIPRDEENAGSYFVNSLLANLVVFALVFWGIHSFSVPLSHALNMPLLVDHFWPLLWYTVFLMFITASVAYLTSRQYIKQAAFFQVFNQIVVSLVTVVVAVEFRDLRSVFRALTITTGFNVIVMLSYIHFAMSGFRATRYFQGIGAQVKYGVVLGAGASLWVLQAKVHQLFVSRYFGQEIFAIYSAGCTQIPIVDFYLQSVAVIALGRFAVLDRDNDWQGTQKLWREILTSLYGIAIPGVILLLIISKPLVITMFTDSYADAIPIFRMNALVKISMLWNAQLVLRGINRNDIVLYVSAFVIFLTPFFLYAGMMWCGLLGVIGAQAVLMIVARLSLQYVHNKVTSNALPFVVTFGEIWGFYRRSYANIKNRVIGH